MSVNDVRVVASTWFAEAPRPGTVVVSGQDVAPAVRVPGARRSGDAEHRDADSGVVHRTPCAPTADASPSPTGGRSRSRGAAAAGAEVRPARAEPLLMDPPLRCRCRRDQYARPSHSHATPRQPAHQRELPRRRPLHPRARVGPRADAAGVIRFGITHFAQDSLGDIVFVTLPSVGAQVTAGQPCGEVESTKSSAPGPPMSEPGAIGGSRCSPQQRRPRCCWRSVASCWRCGVRRLVSPPESSPRVDGGLRRHRAWSAR